MTSDAIVRAEPGEWSGGWPLRRRQLGSVMRLELGRSLSTWGWLALLFLAFAPTFIIGAHALHDRTCNLPEETLVLAGIVQFFYLRVGIFFGCLGVFMRTIRGEASARTLHHLFLAPVRRELLVAGKFAAGVLTTSLVFGAGVLASFTLMYAHFAAGRHFALEGPGLAHLRAYLLLTTLACVGYGAVFLAMSLVFRNPIIPAVLLLLWEGIGGALPVWLKRFSVTHYLKALVPVELPVEWISGLFTVVTEPMPPWAAVSGLLAFTAGALAFACWRIRRVEINYSTD
jgi:ABC-type transport system involved in multi-copper enzyme maturation permease subunit